MTYSPIDSVSLDNPNILPMKKIHSLYLLLG